MKLAWTSRSQYLFENNFFVFNIQPGQISEKRYFQINILSVLSENTVQCPKTFFYVCYISTLFQFFVQWIDLGSKKALQLTHSGYKDTKNFGTKVWGGSLDFNVTFELSVKYKTVLKGHYIFCFSCNFRFSLALDIDAWQTKKEGFW